MGLFLITLIQVFLFASETFAAPRSMEECQALFQPAKRHELVEIRNFGLQATTEARFRKLYSEHKAFREFTDRFFSNIANAEKYTQVSEWLATPLPSNGAELNAQLTGLQQSYERRVALKKHKLSLLVEILSWAKPEDQFKSTDLFFQSMHFDSPKNNVITDSNTSYIVDLLEFGLAHMQIHGLGVDALRADPLMIERLREVNRKFAPAYPDGRSGLYTID